MNDDITVRELELVAAILNALYGNYVEIRSLNRHRADKYIFGYTDAIDVINDVLDERGFDIVHLNKNHDWRGNGSCSGD